jgi:hypothetical protein
MAEAVQDHPKVVAEAHGVDTFRKLTIDEIEARQDDTAGLRVQDRSDCPDRDI